MTVKKKETQLKYNKESRDLKFYEIIKTIAENKGGKLLTSTWLGSNNKHYWQCNKGHTWYARANDVKKGKWCAICSGNAIEDPYGELVSLASSREGKLLSSKYVNNRELLEWQCKKGHQWKSSAGNVKKGSWCPTCSGNQVLTIEVLNKDAEKRGGLCLSTIYKTAHTKYIWQCSKGHQWKATANSIRNGRWCATCSDGLQERLTRYAIESLFEQAFPKIRPSWLVNPFTGYPLELDCYNISLKLAVEYQGEQHYKSSKKFPDIKDVQTRDQIKRGLCAENGICLIEVPYTVKSNDFPKFLYEHVAIHAPHLIPKMKPWLDVVMVDWLESNSITIEDLQNTASKYDGLCMSPSYLGCRAKHGWQCNKGHRWFAVSDSVRRGTWCPICGGNVIEKPLERLRTHAESKGGLLITVDYKGARYKHTWQCINGHQWDATPDNVINKGTWCPECKRSINKIT